MSKANPASSPDENDRLRGDGPPLPDSPSGDVTGAPPRPTPELTRGWLRDHPHATDADAALALDLPVGVVAAWRGADGEASQPAAEWDVPYEESGGAETDLDPEQAREEGDGAGDLPSGSAETDEGAAPGLTRLRALLQNVRAAKGAEAGERIAELLGDGEAMTDLADGVRANRGAMDALFMSLGAVRGQSRRVADLKKHVERLAAQRTVAANEARASQAADLPGGLQTRLSVALRGHPLVTGLRDPPGWRCRPTGLFRVETDPETGEELERRVAHRPIVLEGRSRDVADGTVTLAIGWSAMRCGWSTRFVPRQTVADNRALLALAGTDGPVNSNNARAVASFLADAEAANAGVLPEVATVTRLGWHTPAGEPVFQWGRHLVTSAGTREAPPIEEVAPATWAKDAVHLLTHDAGQRSLASGFVQAGSWSDWVKLFRGVMDHPAAALGVYAAMVPPLLRDLPGVANFIFEFAGETSRGKTTLLRLAASVWGRPDEGDGGLVRTWDATPVFVERLTTLSNFVPLFLDDTRRARRPEDVATVIYNFASGQTRGRGSLTGVNAVHTARSVLLSTAESPATSSSNQGGTRARVLSLWGPPFGEPTAETARTVAALRDGVLKHHGHLGPKLVRWMLTDPRAANRITAAYERHLKKWTGKAGSDAVAGRLAQAVAALAVAKDVGETCLGLPKPSKDPFDTAWKAVRAGAKDADRAAAALLDVLSWCASQQHRLYTGLAGESDGKKVPAGGWIGARTGAPNWEALALLPVEVNTFLADRGYDVEATLRLWDERKWTKRDGKHRRVHAVIDQDRVRCVVINRSAESDAEARSGGAFEDAEDGHVPTEAP